MKISKVKLPALIVAGVLLCVIVAASCITVINAFDNSIMDEHINETKASMQQVTAKVQKDIESKYGFICRTADTLSDSGKDFSYISKPLNLKNYAKNGGFTSVIAVTPDGIACDSEGNKIDVSDREYFIKAASGKSNISERLQSRFGSEKKDVIAYAAPIYSEETLIAVLCGIVSADLNVTQYSEYTDDMTSGMYILDSDGKMVMSSYTEEGRAFYATVQGSKYADGTDSGYQPLEFASDSDNDGETLTGDTNYYYAGNVTDASGLFGWLFQPTNTSSIYFKKPLSQNNWTLFYVRSVKLTDSTVQFIIISRVMLFVVVIIFLTAMIVLLWMQSKSNKAITDLAYKDEITGRANWQKFTVVGNGLINKQGWWASNYAALHIDINRFTLYNDYYGHEAGDSLLKYLAETMDLMSSAKEICARRGSDKFVALWSYTDREYLENRINELFELVKDGPHGSNVSLSVGIYPLNEGDKDIVHATDMAKMAGETVNGSKTDATAFFDENLRKALTEEQELEELMHTALEKDEFKLFLQPKHSVQSGALEGAEALVRWISPSKGFISPGRFIPLFEKNGFVAQVDNYILEQLCIFQKKRLNSGKKIVPISVNVSRVQLSNPNLAEEICAIVDKHGVPHKYIDLELTESACFDDLEVLVNTITNLRKMGFPVSMDDFGSGYSSLNLLKELPFDTLKIDGEFFRNVSDLNRANIVVKNIIELAKSLNMNVVAEGIETQDQVEYLRTTECDLIQGYYYSKPISASDFEKYMSKNLL